MLTPAFAQGEDMTDGGNYIDGNMSGLIWQKAEWQPAYLLIAVITFVGSAAHKLD